MLKLVKPVGLVTADVQVLQHDSTTAAAISNEVDLVMSFRHPNIVSGSADETAAACSNLGCLSTPCVQSLRSTVKHMQA
jgi:hypothetical protein